MNGTLKRKRKPRSLLHQVDLSLLPSTMRKKTSATKSQQQQEKKEEEREVAVEKGEEVVVDESIKVVDEGEVVRDAEDGETAKAVQVDPSIEKEVTATAEEGTGPDADGGETLTSLKSNPVLETASPASIFPKGSKRKNPFPNHEEEDEARTASPRSRPIKKAKKVGFSGDTVSPVERPRRMSIPYVARPDDDEDMGNSESVNVVVGGSEHDERDLDDDGVDDLFED